MKTGDVVLDRPRYADHPEFIPDVSPGSMLAAGVFDGGYWSSWGEDQLEGIDSEILRQGPHRDMPNARLHNAFGVHSGLDLAEWRRRGWINDAFDQVGWFQWYCRFHSGRRCEDDARQIGRWLDFRNRWQPKSIEALGRMKPGAKTRQALLSWAIDPYRPERELGVLHKDQT